MMNDGAAYCPECFSEKPFFAPRCHACNEYIGFWYQLLTMYALWGTIFFGAWFFWGGFVNWFDQSTPYIFNWMVPVYFAVYILVPFIIGWIIAKLRQIFGWWLLVFFIVGFLLLGLTA